MINGCATVCVFEEWKCVFEKYCVETLINCLTSMKLCCQILHTYEYNVRIMFVY